MKEVKELAELDAIVSEGGKVVVDFWAAWCGPCRAIAPTMEKLAEDGAVVVKVNVDEAAEISARYSIRNLPTVVLFDKSSEQKRLIGTKSLSEYKEQFGL